jgi:transposase
VLDLGQLELPKEKWKLLANRIEEITSGASRRLFPVEPEIEALAQHYASVLLKNRLKEKKSAEKKEPRYETVDVDSINSEKPLAIGGEYAVLEMMKKLQLTDILSQIGMTEKQIQLAQLLVCGRAVHPSSERELKRYAEHDSAFGPLIGVEPFKIGHNSLYQVSDILVKNRSLIEEFLAGRTKKMFSLKETIILYDLTNTHFEGASLDCSKSKRGHSKQKRTDCPLVTLGLVLDNQGFVKCSEVFDGNVIESKTLPGMIDTLKKRHRHQTLGELPPDFTVVLDAGIATKEVITYLREHGHKYIIKSRTQPDIPKGGEFNPIKEGVKARTVQANGETILHCKSEGRSKKENAMLDRFKTRMEAGLKKLHEGLSKPRCTKKYDLIQQRIGKIRQNNAIVSPGFEITVERSGETATSITWIFDRTKLSKSYDGSYYIRTNHMNMNQDEIWSIYVMLTRVEDAFRCMKSCLQMRPVFHSTTRRVEGHLFIAVLAYQVVSCIQYMLKEAGIHHRWSTIARRLNTQKLITTSLNLQNGGKVVMRYCSKATLHEHEIYQALKISPVPLNKIRMTQM